MSHVAGVAVRSAKLMNSARRPSLPKRNLQPSDSNLAQAGRPKKVRSR
jgi:hypothetical protein